MEKEIKIIVRAIVLHEEKLLVVQHPGTEVKYIKD